MVRLVSISLLLALVGAISFTQPKTIRVPQDQATVQAGINAAVNGDTVLVAEGTHTANLLITKKIVLGSLYIVDGDTSHISKTILDGSTPVNPDTGAVITIRNADTTLLITGFTITKGSGNKHINTYWSPTGISLTGGGIEVNGGGATIKNNIITRNSIKVLLPATDGWGGGIEVLSIDVQGSTTYSIIESNVISNNSIIGGTESGGGGIDFTGSGRIINNKILGNSSMYSSNGLGQSLAYKKDTAVVENNLFQGNSVSWIISGFAIGGSGMTAYIRNNVFIDNTSDSIGSSVCWVGDECNTVFERNYITRNGGWQHGIALRRGATSLIRNNIIVNNSGTGIVVDQSTTATIINNTIVGNNRYGISGTGTGYLLNNISWNNALGNISPLSVSFSTAYNLIGAGPLGTGDVDSNPDFVANDTLYRLSDTSPCIGAGIASSTLSGALVTAPLFDFLNTPRPRAAGTRPDMGAVENGPLSAAEDASNEIPSGFALHQNYPNPFNPETNFEFRIANFGLVKLAVHDLLGREIAVLVDEAKPAGVYTVRWDAVRMPSGVYFCKLEARNAKGETWMQTRKMLLMK